MYLRCLFSLVPALLLSLSLEQPSSNGDQEPWKAQLKQVGFEPTPEGIEKYLNSLLLTPDRTQQLRKLLAELGSDRYPTRERATAQLLRLPPAPQFLLDESAASDLETRQRVQQILSKPPNLHHRETVLVVLRAVEINHIKGLCSLLLEMMPQWREPYLSQAAAKAVEASALPADAKVLRRVLAESQLPAARAAAVAALAAALDHESVPELEPVLSDATVSVRIAAAMALLNQGNRKPLPILVDLLEADNTKTRQTAAAILTAVSAKQFDFAGYDEPKRRARGVAAWREWVDQEGATAELHLPISAVTIPRGRILIGIWPNQLREVDMASGKTLFETGGFSYVWGCHATPDGHRLAVDFNQSIVVEYDSEGKECWRHSVPGHPISVEREPNGLTLLALAEPGILVQLDREGQVIWKLSIHGRPTTVYRIKNGNLLVCLQEDGRVVEIDPQGKELWQVAGLNRPHTAQPLANGNVLILEMGSQRVVEYDRSGKLVWVKEGFNNPAQAQRLFDGNTLVSDNTGVKEFDRQGNQVRLIAVSRAKFFAY